MIDTRKFSISSSGEERFKYYIVVNIAIRLKGGNKMGKVIVKNVVKRKKGFLYYVDGKGNVCEAKMARGGKRKKAKKKRR